MTDMLTDTAHQTALLDRAIKSIGEMMILPLADRDEVDAAVGALRQTVADVLAQTFPATDPGLAERRAQVQEVETALDALPEEVDEAAIAIWDIARDAFRKGRRRAANERFRATRIASEEMA